MTHDLWRYRFHRDVTVFSTTRKGGYSQGEHGEFNINPWVGDAPEAVAQNRELLAAQLRLRDSSRLLMPHQVHGTEIRHITRDFLTLGPDEQAALLEGADALMTDVPSLVIGVSTADCVPILLYDAEHHAACAVHAGWRGTMGRIAQKAVQAMRATYGSRPEELRALVGPAIMLSEYEVGYDVYSQFQKAGFRMELITVPVSFRGSEDLPLEERKWMLDLPFCNRFQLEDCGLKERRIVLTMLSSYSREDEFFSVRRQGAGCGRTYTGIML